MCLDGFEVLSERGIMELERADKQALKSRAHASMCMCVEARRVHMCIH